MWKTSLIFPKNLMLQVHLLRGEDIVPGSTDFSSNFKLSISHIPQYLFHLSPSRVSDTTHRMPSESFAGMLW